MKIEGGKTYLTRRGDKVKIQRVEPSPHSPLCFYGSKNSKGYYEDGRCSCLGPDSGPCSWDLVKEVGALMDANEALQEWF
jgi:hypothetical protein